MKKHIKIALIGISILALASYAIFYMMAPVPVRMVEATKQVAELTFMEQGVVTAENTVQVYTSIQGEINEICVREGQEVKAGDILLRVDDSSLRLQLEQVHSGIRSLEAQLAGVDIEDEAKRQNLISARDSLRGELMAINAQAAQNNQVNANNRELQNEQSRIQQVLIARYESELALALDNYERIEALYQSGALARIDLEAASSSVMAAEAQLEVAIGQLAVIAADVPQNSAEYFNGLRASINAQLAGINQQLAQDTAGTARTHYEALIAVEYANAALLERAIENSAVAAPVSGIVSTLYARNTNFVSPAAPVAEIIFAGIITIDSYVSAQDVSSISIGDTVALTLRRRTGDIEFSGQVTEIDSSAVIRFSALGIEERKVNVQIAPWTPADVAIVLGSALDVYFNIFREEEKIVIPRTAVFRDNGQDMVWAVRGSDRGKVTALPVVTGMELRTDIVIESGLGEGDFIITDANNPDINEGKRVANEW